MSNTTDIAVPDQVYSPEKITNFHPARKTINSFPGQAEPCPVCGALATEAPEGVYGVHVKMDSSHNVGDAVWENQHCFKCGFRSGNDAVLDRQKAFQEFLSWYDRKTADDANHPSFTTGTATQIPPPPPDDEMAKLREALASAEARLAAREPATAETTEEGTS